MGRGIIMLVGAQTASHDAQMAAPMYSWQHPCAAPCGRRLWPLSTPPLCRPPCRPPSALPPSRPAAVPNGDDANEHHERTAALRVLRVQTRARNLQGSRVPPKLRRCCRPAAAYALRRPTGS